MAVAEHVIDLEFPVIQSATVHVDHGHALYGAIKHVCSDVQRISSLGIHPLRGTMLEGGMLLLKEREPLRLRIPAESIHLALPLAGKVLRIVDSQIRLGTPSIHILAPSQALWARTVTMKFTEAMKGSAERQLRGHLAKAFPEATFSIRRPRTIRIHGKQILGFEILAERLTELDSMKLQEEGFGGRRAFGCGIFVAVGATPRNPSMSGASAVPHGLD